MLARGIPTPSPTTSMFIAVVVVVAAIAGVGEGFLTSRLLQNSGDGRFLTTEEHWLNQTLDHFSPQDHRTFNQRYYEFLDHFRAPDGPIFLKICGESSCDGIQNDYVGVLAKKFGAAIVSLEHRYYGKSSPFKSLATENLRFLSSKQALFDLAAFRQFYQASFVSISLNLKRNKASAENPWFVFGVSYPGALSAWFRLKFPHLTCGSLASSAVVNAIYDFPEFDQQVGESAGAECKAALQEVTKLVEQRLVTNQNAVKSAFGASELSIDGDFLYFLADAAVMAFQYGNPDALCSPLVQAKKDGGDPVAALLDCIFQLVQYFLLRIPWYHLDLCRNVFGDGVYPEVDATNLYYGGTKIAGSKIVFTNGSQDPWRHASKQASSSEMPSYLISCHNCGHGSDLRGCPQSPLNPEGNDKNCSSPDAVNKVRQQITDLMDLWLSECTEAERGWSAA
ncbi:putative serine protease EDA2 [Drosera capensis]